MSDIEFSVITSDIIKSFDCISVYTDWSAESIFVSMATHNPKQWGCANKNMHISAAIHPTILNLVPNYFLVIQHFIDSSICKLSNLYKYMIFYENLQKIAGN